MSKQDKGIRQPASGRGPEKLRRDALQFPGQSPARSALKEKMMMKTTMLITCLLAGVVLAQEFPVKMASGNEFTCRIVGVSGKGQVKVLVTSGDFAGQEVVLKARTLTPESRGTVGKHLKQWKTEQSTTQNIKPEPEAKTDNEKNFSVELQGWSWYRTPGHINVEGVARNVSPKPMTYVPARICCYSAEGDVVTRDMTYLNIDELNDLNPGESTTFDLLITDDPTITKLTVSFGDLDDPLPHRELSKPDIRSADYRARVMAMHRKSPLQVSRLQWEHRGRDLVVSGMVKNTSDTQLDDVAAHVDLYANEVQIIDKAREHIERKNLKPGQTSPFRVSVIKAPKTVAIRLTFWIDRAGVVPFHLEDKSIPIQWCHEDIKRDARLGWPDKRRLIPQGN